jgi:hypothetical protein
VFEYSLGDKRIREKRPDAEVFSEDSLGTLEGAYVTIDHPTMDPKDVAVGRVIKASANPPYVDGVIQLEDDRAIRMVDNGQLTELSCGYHMVLVQNDGEDAEFVQTQIRYDHAALGPAGWGRLGRDVCLRLDSNNNQIVTYVTDEEVMAEPEKAIEPVTTHVDSVDSKLDMLIAAVNKLVTVQVKEQDSPIKKITELPSESAIEAIAQKKADLMLKLELEARDAHAAFFPNDYVAPVWAGRQCCEAVLRTVDPTRTITDSEDIASLVKEAQLLARKQRVDDESRKPTISTLAEKLGRGIPAAALQTPKSGLRARLGV